MPRYSAPPDENDKQPLLWLNGHAIYAAYAIVLVYVVSMLLTTALLAFRVSAPLAWLPYSSEAVLRGEAWRVLTYGLVNQPSIWFAVDMFMIGWFGRDLEKFFGRRIFLQFYGGLYLLVPLLFTLLGRWLPMKLAGEAGSFALFIAFATLYPDAPFFGAILARWLALILVGIYTLMHLASRDAASLISLWSTVAFAHGFVRFQQGRFTLPSFKLWSRQPKLRVLPDLTPEEKRQALQSTDKSMAEMDALLDKIARSGIDSLTAKERTRLEQSRTELLKRRGPGGASRPH